MFSYKPVKDRLANKYGIKRYALYMNKQPINRHIITIQHPNGKEEFVSIVSSNYKIIPNEVVLDITNEVIQEWRANPFNFDKPTWFKTYSYYSEHDYIITDGIRLYAFYSLGKAEIQPDDFVEYGILILNSIDGSMRFGCGGFTYRYICHNMVTIMANKILRKELQQEENFITKVVKRT